ncbi:MAG: gliding-motility protein MglA [Archangium sp.]|nr:gliding-motility protein MglA [Archangium sp.]MDP3574529.1 gliding-motility protein MglA [Archangium sp.]
MRFAWLLLFASTTASAAYIDYEKREINLKVVYVSATDGAHANLEYVFSKTNPEAKGKATITTVPSPKGSAVKYFDFLPLALGEIRGFKVRFHLYGVRSEKQDTAVKLVLKGADGIVFVASAAPHAQKDNRVVFDRLKSDLAAQGYDLKSMPFVLQLDTDGVTDPVTLEALRKTLGLGETTAFTATPTSGQGVFDTLKGIAKLTLMELKKGAADAGR